MQPWKPDSSLGICLSLRFSLVARIAQRRPHGRPSMIRSHNSCRCLALPIDDGSEIADLGIHSMRMVHDLLVRCEDVRESVVPRRPYVILVSVPSEMLLNAEARDRLRTIRLIALVAGSVLASDAFTISYGRVICARLQCRQPQRLYWSWWQLDVNNIAGCRQGDMRGVGEHIRK